MWIFSNSLQGLARPLGLKWHSRREKVFKTIENIYWNLQANGQTIENIYWNLHANGQIIENIYWNLHANGQTIENIYWNLHANGQTIGLRAL